MLGRHIIWAAVVALVALALPATATARGAAGRRRPVVTAVHPNSGSTSGWAHVIVRGRGFTRANVVDFGGVRARRVHIVSADELTAYAPPQHNGVVTVTVRTPDGSSVSSPTTHYRYVHAQLPAQWTALRSPTPAGYSAMLDQSIEAVDCPSTRCYYLAELYTSRHHSTPVIGTYDGTTVRDAVAPDPDGKPYTFRDPEFSQLVCAGSRFCVASGVDGPSRGRGPAVLLSLDAGQWTASTAPLPPNAPSSVLDEVIDDVSCGAPGSCVAVGYLKEANDVERDVVDTLHGGTWTSAFAPAPISTGDKDGGARVSCAGASWCLIASGRYLVVDRSGRYSVESFTYPPPTVKGDYVAHALLGLDCPAVDDCTLLIETYTGPGMAYDFLTMRSAKLTHFRITAPADSDSTGNGQLAADRFTFSCTDAKPCVTNFVYSSAGFDGQALVVGLRDDSVRVSAMPQFTARLRPPVSVDEATCSGIAACVAVGDERHRATYEVFADGVWTPQVINTSRLSGLLSAAADEVSCAPSGRCLAMGHYTYVSARGVHHPPSYSGFLAEGDDR